MADLDTFRDDFVPNIQAHARLSFATWQKSSPGDYARWVAYRDALLAGQPSIPPAMTTKYGRALVAAGRLVSAGDVPPPAPLPLPRAVADFGVPTSGDAAPAFQAMIDQLRDGDAVAVESELFTFNSPVSLQNRAALRIVGLGGQSKNDGGYWSTTRIQPGRDGIALFEDVNASVKHVGTAFEWINLVSQRANVRGWDMRNVNSWKLLYCSAQGRFARHAVYTDVPTSQYPGGDNSYANVLEGIFALSEGCAIYGEETLCMRVEGGYIDAPGGVVLKKASECRFHGGKSNHAGRLFAVYGAWNTIEWSCEQYDSTGTHVYALEVLRDPNMGVPWSGQENRIVCDFADHPYGSGLMVHLGPGTSGNVVDSAYVGGDTDYYLDEGSGNVRRR